MEKKGRQITIKDIARELEISPSTVSRALKGYETISLKTRKAVEELARKYNYQPNSIALSLRQQRSNTIGVIIPEIVHFFFSTVISGIEDVAYKAGYNVIISQSNESFEREVSDTHALMRSRVDGMLVSMSRKTDSFDHFQELQERGIPLVFFDRVCPDLNTSRVVVDDQGGAYKGVKHLIEIGCRNIIHLAGPAHLLISKNRKSGYIDALQQAGIAVDESNIIPCEDGTIEQAYALVKALIDNNKVFDGIFATNDMSAMGAMHAIQDAGLTIPDDVAVVGFSDWQIAALARPSLTSIHQPGFEMGQMAAQLFLEQMEDAQGVARIETLETELVIRDSTSRRS